MFVPGGNPQAKNLFEGLFWALATIVHPLEPIARSTHRVECLRTLRVEWRVRRRAAHSAAHVRRSRLTAADARSATDRTMNVPTPDESDCLGIPCTRLTWHQRVAAENRIQEASQ